MDKFIQNMCHVKPLQIKIRTFGAAALPLVPTLRVATHVGNAPRRVRTTHATGARAAERPDGRSHAERGNETLITLTILRR